MRRRQGILLLALILILLGPALANPRQWVVGTAWIDGYGTQWFYWFAEQVIHGKQDFDHTNLLFYPWGKDVYLHTGGNLLDAALALPLRALVGPVLGYNLWCALLLLGNYLGGTLLAASLGVPAERRWPSGLVLLLNPYLLQELQQGRPTQAFLLFPALTAAGLWRLSRPDPPRPWLLAVGTGLALAASGLQYWYYGLFLGGLALMFGGVQVLCGPRRAFRLGTYSVAAMVSVLVSLPLALKMLVAIKEGEVPGLISMDGTGLLAPLALQTREGEDLGLYVMDLFGGTFGSLVDDGGFRYVPGGSVLSSGWGVWLALGLWQGRRERGLWMGLVGWAAISILVAIGPAWIWDGRVVAANPPYLWLLEWIPVLRRWWWPGRAVFGLWLVLAALLPGVMAGRAGRWVTALLALALGWNLRSAALFPLDRWDGREGPVLECLAKAPEGAVINLPYVRQQESLYYQTLHQKPLLGGMLVTKPSFGPPELKTLLQENSLLAALLSIGQRNYSPTTTPLPEDRQALLGLGYRYVLVEIQGFLRPKPRGDGTADMVSDWGRARRLLSDRLEGSPAQEDDRFALWVLDGTPPCP